MSVPTHEVFLRTLAAKIAALFLNPAFTARALDAALQISKNLELEYPIPTLSTGHIWAYNAACGNRNVPARVQNLRIKLETFKLQSQTPEAILQVIIDFIEANKTHWQIGAVNMVFVVELTKAASTDLDIELLNQHLILAKEQLTKFPAFMRAEILEYRRNQDEETDLQLSLHRQDQEGADSAFDNVELQSQFGLMPILDSNVFAVPPLTPSPSEEGDPRNEVLVASTEPYPSATVKPLI